MNIKIPPHIWVTISGWGSRITLALSQLVCIRLITEGLGEQSYAVFAILTGLVGWYTLSDLGLGLSLQNRISKSRANEQNYEHFVHASMLIALVLLLFSVLLVAMGGGIAGPFLLKQFDFIEGNEKYEFFLTTSLLYICVSIGAISYKVMYAENIGYVGNIIQAIAAIIGVASMWYVINHFTENQIYYCLVVFVGPNALLALLCFAYRCRTFTYQSLQSFKENGRELLYQGGRFWLFSLMAIGVVQVDYVIMSQFLSAAEITQYAIVSKVFTFIFYLFNSVTLALWPVFSELTEKNEWGEVSSYLKKYIVIGVLYAVATTGGIVVLMPFIANLLVGEAVVISVSLVLLFGLYNLVRVWSDLFATVLQSKNDLRPFLQWVPVQAMVGGLCQWYFVQEYGPHGIVIGLVASFVATVVWVLPLRYIKHYRQYKYNNLGVSSEI